MTAPRSLILDLNAELAGHLTVAIHLHRDWATKTGLRRPAGMDELAERLASRAMRGQEGTPLDDLWAVREREVMPRRLLTYQEAASVLACSERTVKRLVAYGDLRSVQLAAGAARIRVVDLDEYVERLATPSTAGAS